MAKTEVLYVHLERDQATGSSEALERPLGLSGKALGLTLPERHLDRILQRRDRPPSPPSTITSSRAARFSFPGSNRAGAYGFYKPILAGMTDGLEPREVARLLVDYEDRLFLHDCLIMCRFYRDLLDWETLAAMVGATAGRAVDVPELQEVVGGLLTRVRRLNFGLGMTADEDGLPSRFFREPLEGAAPLDETAFGACLRAYYELRGWDRLDLT